MTTSIKENSKRSNRLILFLKISLLFSVGAIFFDFYQYRVWSNHGFNPRLDSWSAADYNYPDVLAFDLHYGIFALVYIPQLIIGYVFFIQWFRRAYCNLNRVGIDTDKKEGWAAGAWFIPLYCFIGPYQIIKEIWLKTQEYYKDSTEYYNILKIWWTLWVVSNIVINCGSGIAFNSILADALEFRSILCIVADALYIPATLIVIQVVKKVSSFEKEMYKKAILEEGLIEESILSQ